MERRSFWSVTCTVALVGLCAATVLLAQTPAPVLQSMSPSSAPQGTSLTVTLSGNNFAPRTGVRLSGSGAAQTNAAVVNSSTVTVKFTFSTTAALGVHNVYVTNTAGNSQQLPFTVTAPVASTTIAPAAATLNPSRTQIFAAAVSGAANTTVTWSLSPNVGMLSVSGNLAAYTAPATVSSVQTVRITATGSASASGTASAVVTLMPNGTLSLGPSGVSVAPGGTQQFMATAQGAGNTGVTWSIAPNVGTISSAGLYSAPATIIAAQTVTVTATSVQNQALSASTQFSLTPGTAVPAVLSMRSGGLATLSWNGQSFLDTVLGNPSFAYIYQTDAAGNTSSLPAKPTATVTSLQNDVVTQTYAWGTVATHYAAIGNKLLIQVTIQNLSPNTISRYWMFPVSLQLPATPANFSNNAEFNIDEPSSIFWSYGTGTVDLVNEDVTTPLALAFWPSQSPAASRWRVSMYVDPGQNLNPNWPAVPRPIAPGASDTLTVSVRFGGPTATEPQMASDIFSLFASTYPRTLPATPAHKPLARLSFTGSFQPTFATNPRGWFNDPTVDVITPAGIAAFQARLLAAADAAIAEMQRVGAAGGIIWDIEGQQLDQSYIGDPSWAETLAPELVGVLDAFVARFKSAGFPIGFTLRPQAFSLQAGLVNVSGTSVTWAGGARFSPAWAGQQGGGEMTIGNNNYVIGSVQSPTQLTLATSAGAATAAPYMYGLQTNTSNPAAVLQAKVQYAVNRWGASLFYVDSDLTYNGASITPAQIFGNLTRQFPGTMYFPEWKNTRHYAYTYPFLDATNGITEPATLVNYVYPSAGGLVRVPGDSQILAAEPALIQSVINGNILLFDGWYQHSANDTVIQIYQQTP